MSCTAAPRCLFDFQNNLSVLMNIYICRYVTVIHVLFHNPILLVTYGDM